MMNAKSVANAFATINKLILIDMSGHVYKGNTSTNVNQQFTE